MNMAIAEERISLRTTETSSGSYDIVIGANLIARLSELADFQNHTRILIVVDDKLKAAISPTLAPLAGTGVFIAYVACGEKNKDFTHLQSLLDAFHRAGLDRKSLVINIGGGMLGDFAGFAASVYMRGIDFVQVPTTLLAQVDASVGGKVAINFAGVKNLIGSFRQPKLVIIDAALLASLPERELYSGYAEIIKHALIFDHQFIEELERAPVEPNNLSVLIPIIKRSCQIKANVVAQDPHESGLRKILNFGHTIGHGIEAAAAEIGSPLLHGECVALGMVAEAELSRTIGALSAEDCHRITRLLSRYRLPIRTESPFPRERLIEFMRHDKKNSSGRISCALLMKLGACTPAVDVSEEQVRDALTVLGL